MKSCIGGPLGTIETTMFSRAERGYGAHILSFNSVFRFRIGKLAEGSQGLAVCERNLG